MSNTKAIRKIEQALDLIRESSKGLKSDTINTDWFIAVLTMDLKDAVEILEEKDQKVLT